MDPRHHDAGTVGPSIGHEASGTGQPTVSVVIVTRNEARYIQACLGSVVAQSYPSDHLEIIVADGRSTDATAELVRAWAQRDARIRLLRNELRITPCGLNVAITAARGDVIVWLSGHSIVRQDHVARCVSGLREHDAWAIGGAIHRVWHTARQEANARATSSPFGVGNAVHNYAQEGRWVETAFPGAWPRWVFERVGLFDPELRRNQDDELSYRIREAGGRIWYDPMIAVDYTPRPTLATIADQYRQYGYYKVRVFQKHPRSARWRHLVPAALVAFLFASPAAVLLSPVAIPVATAGYVAYGSFIAFAVARTRRETASALQVATSLIGVHVGYGVGLLQGLVRFAPRWFIGRAPSPPELQAP